MKHLTTLLLTLLVYGSLWAEKSIESKELALMCQDFIELKRTEGSGYCMGYFKGYYKKNISYWDAERADMSKSERFWWDTIFPCKLSENMEGSMVKKFIYLVNMNDSLAKIEPLEVVRYTYDDECKT